MEPITPARPLIRSDQPRAPNTTGSDAHKFIADKKQAEPKTEVKKVVKSEAESKMIRRDSTEFEKRIRSLATDLVRGTKLEFEFDKTDKRVVVRVYDKESGDLLRQIPPEELSRLVDESRSLKTEAKGRLIIQEA